MWNKMWHEKSSYPVLALPPEIRQGLFVPRGGPRANDFTPTSRVGWNSYGDDFIQLE